MTVSFHELHSLIIYIVFGYAILFPLVLASLRLLNINRAVQRMHIFLTAFLTPLAIFIIYHTILVKRCESGLPPLWAENAFHLLCIVTEGMLFVFVPLLGLLTAVAFFKALAAALMIKRLIKKAVPSENEFVKKVSILAAEKSKELGIAPPQVIFSRRDGYVAFTIGLIKPVIVINYNMIDFLSQREIEAIISHELIHVKNKDALKNWLLHFVRDIVILNPLSALLLKGYLIEKEVVCDQQAAELIGQKPHEYASTLLKVWRSIADRQEMDPAVASNFAGSSGMERRIKALLDSSQGNERASGTAVFIGGVIMFLVTLLVLGLVC